MMATLSACGSMLVVAAGLTQEQVNLVSKGEGNSGAPETKESIERGWRSFRRVDGLANSTTVARDDPVGDKRPAAFRFGVRGCVGV
jgi:hypothetical protein